MTNIQTVEGDNECSLVFAVFELFVFLTEQAERCKEQPSLTHSVSFDKNFCQVVLFTGFLILSIDRFARNRYLPDNRFTTLSLFLCVSKALKVVIALLMSIIFLQVTPTVKHDKLVLPWIDYIADLSMDGASIIGWLRVAPGG